MINNEPAIIFKNVLSNNSYKLLNKMILDLKSKMPENERIYHKDDNSSLIYNMFKGEYQFSYKQYKEIYDCLYNHIKENVLVPRNLEGRKEKLKQYNIKLLSQEVIEGDLEIDESFEGIPEELVKLKEIKGDVYLKINKGYIPSWLKNVKIGDSFVCFGNNLTSLENCPQYVSGTFYCTDNYLTSLKGCPKYIGGSLWCRNNKIKLQLPNEVQLKGYFYNE